MTDPASTDRIEKTILLRASLPRVWQALTDHQEFGAWFQVRLDGPFIPGTVSTGRMTVPGYEHLNWRAEVVAMQPMTRLAFTWHPYAIDPTVDYTAEPQTLVDFRLEETPEGTRLTVTESGFDAIPPGRRPEALRMNGKGWAIQVDNIARHVGG